MAEAKEVKETKKAAKTTISAKTTKKTPAKAEANVVKEAEKAAVKKAAEKIENLVETEKIAEAIVEAEKQLAEEQNKPIAKAGKRSAKALAEKEARLAKEERKAHPEGQSQPVHKPAPKARPHHERAGKKYREAYAKIDKSKEYSLAETLELAVATSTTKFDGSVELHVRLNVDPRQADQNIRDSFVLPEGTGKLVTVSVFGEADDVAAAKKAGADICGTDEFLQQLEKGTINFDILIATPAVMPKLGKYARLLGPKGLMPNPKSGTVTKDVTKAVKEAKAGRVEYRVDSTGIVHVSIGKVSFGKDRLQTNAKTVLASIKAAKPASIKGAYVKSIFVATSMGPSIKLATSEL